MDEIENLLEDWDYSEQQALIWLHILPEEYRKINYIEFNKMMAAQPRDKRAVDIMDILEAE